MLKPRRCSPPDTNRWIGRRDHALLAVAIQTGLRVSELTGLRCQDIQLGRGAHLRCTGKGRKDRCTPLTSHTVTILREWVRERGGQPADALFPTSRGRPLSRDAVALLTTRHAATAGQSCPSLQAKTITPHMLRHYVDGRVMCLEAASPLVAEPRVLVPAT